MKNTLGDGKQITAKSKNMEDMTGYLRTKFVGKSDVRKLFLSTIFSFILCQALSFVYLCLQGQF